MNFTNPTSLLRAISPRQLAGKMAPFIGKMPGKRVLDPRMSALGPDAPSPASLGRIGSLEVRLARTASEVRAAQSLRYRVFYKEMAAVADVAAQMTRRDADAYDRFCDHLLVLDHDDIVERPFRRSRPRIVGTYRLLRQDVAEKHCGFYTAAEFDIGPVIASHRHLKFLELGRSCVLKEYRTKRTVELLWQGIWAYVLQHGIDVMLGCASIEGTDPAEMALPLSFLHHNSAARDDWYVRANADRYVSMNRMPAGEIDMKAALHALPPLIKGYLRLGAMIGDGAVIDRQFGTTDVLIILPVSAISPRYVNYYGADASRHAS